MKRFLAAVALAVLPSLAHAGVGLTWYTGPSFGSKGIWSNPMSLPTIDIHNEQMLIQLHALDLVAWLPAKEIALGGDMFMTTRHLKVNEDIGGVIAPGGGLDILTDTGFNAFYVDGQAKLRMGAQTQKGMGFGIYVVPGIGLGMGGGELDFLYSGQLQISIWTNK